MKKGTLIALTYIYATLQTALIAQQPSSLQRASIEFSLINGNTTKTSPPHQYKTLKQTAQIQSDPIPIPLNQPTPFIAITVMHRSNGRIPQIWIRTLTTSTENTPWIYIQWDQVEKTIEGYTVSNIIFVNKSAKFFQYRTDLADGTPTQEYSFRFFSPGDIPMSTPKALFPKSPTKISACAQPKFVPRTAWNCPTGEAPSGPIEYTTVSHLIVHHSDSDNTSPNWAAVVLSFWNDHVYNRKWSDIGYNWLIAPDGTIFEGRGGGDNVQGAHLCGANANTLGVCVIGTYITETPSDTALRALSNLLAWKAAKENINPLNASLHPASGYILPHIAGHKNGCAPGYTVCPGDVLYALLPALRVRVTNLINSCNATTPTASTTQYPTTNSDGVRIFPNPTTGSLTLELKTGTTQYTHWKIFNALGKAIYESPPFQFTDAWTGKIELADTPSGIYALNIWLGNKRISKKIEIRK